MDAHAGFVLPVGWNVTLEKEEAACLRSLPSLSQRGSSIVEVERANCLAVFGRWGVEEYGETA